MYFVVTGKNSYLSSKELKLFGFDSFKRISKNILLIDSYNPDDLDKLGGVIKYGKIISFDQIKNYLNNKDIIGTNSKTFGLKLKKTFGIKKFKLIQPENTDLEVKNHGKEFLFFEDKVLLVEGYQKIDLYETIDYQKPSRGMKVGMMPSKLAHIMINLCTGSATGQVETIYDPFVGFGTTGFVANYFGYNFLGSDINTTPAKQNLSFWKQTDYYKNMQFTLFKNDVKTPFEKKFLNNVDCIVTEGWLGPVINNNTTQKMLTKNHEDIYNLYNAFLQNISKFYDNICMVFCFPIYSKMTNYGFGVLNKLEKGNMEFDFEKLGKPYKRDGQLVGRQIILAKK
ncbi:DNA methyltransferase [Candidatus Absconditicoccus praedator]|uniref:DNA methyltransferase n=1 Tax=Candidatus Absconditicoccus praedator TaxID=2735562 RepID=UPI001E320815|nr:DNA methyltransferase [Candidatus Absconditicoccus praedator]UFX83445.1 hypothetical protein HLG78_04930 [Candidatus Absconditicoccus praedator]